MQIFALQVRLPIFVLELLAAAKSFFMRPMSLRPIKIRRK
jgi:hypothetical protein